jgi:hypothetical protein
MDTNSYVLFGGVALFSIILSLYTFIWMNKERKKQSEMIKEIEIHSKVTGIRYDLERQLEAINKKLLSSEDRWQDINHLILAGQNSINTKHINTKLDSFSFLEKSGVDMAEIRIEKDLIFYLTPFHIENDSYFSVKNACDNMGLRLKRGDEIYLEKKQIFSNILENIVKSRLIIVNIEGRNPNVFYELGIAHALNKPTILISSDIKKVPFDLQSQYIVLYSGNKDLEIKIQRALSDVFINDN